MVQRVVSYYGRDKITKINKSPDHKCSYSLGKVEKIISRASWCLDIVACKFIHTYVCGYVHACYSSPTEFIEMLRGMCVWCSFQFWLKREKIKNKRRKVKKGREGERGRGKGERRKGKWERGKGKGEKVKEKGERRKERKTIIPWECIWLCCFCLSTHLGGALFLITNSRESWQNVCIHQQEVCMLCGPWTVVSFLI